MKMRKKNRDNTMDTGRKTQQHICDWNDWTGSIGLEWHRVQLLRLWSGCHRNWGPLFYFPIKLPIAICSLFCVHSFMCITILSNLTCHMQIFLSLPFFRSVKANTNNRKMPDQIKNATWALCTYFALCGAYWHISLKNVKQAKKKQTKC